jgi:hypothetical protein
MTLFALARSWLAAAALATLLHLLPATTQAQTAATAAAPVTVGQPLPALALKDQHDQIWQVSVDTRLVLFAAGRKASSLVQAVLEKEPKDFLARRRTVYLADLSKMPGFATRMFALPALREMPFRVGVSLNESTLAGWPREPEGVALVELANGVVQRIGNARTETELRAAIDR